MSGHLKTCHCGRRALPGYFTCALHPAPQITEAERLKAQPWRAGYSDPLFARNRPLAYERDGRCCVKCGAPLEEHEYISDHVLPLSEGGTSEIDNLQTLCKPCSKAKTRMDRRARAVRSRG